MIDISSNHLDIVVETISKHLADCQVRVFGSRYKHTAKKYSDLDIALVGEAKIDWKIIACINDELEESDLPFRVDILDWNSISPQFRKTIIESGFEVLNSKRD